MKTLERRIQALETQHRGLDGFELWIGDEAVGNRQGALGARVYELLQNRPGVAEPVPLGLMVVGL